MFNALDVILATVALLILFVWIRRGWAFFGVAEGEDYHRNWSGFFRFLLGQKKILERPLIGLAHIVVFWGVILPMAVGILAQFPFTLPDTVAKSLSSTLDILGFATLLACSMFLVRRISVRDPAGPNGIIAPIVILIIICLSGFLAEAARVRITQTSSFWLTPVGYIISTLLPPSPLLMQVMIRIHIISVLLFVAALPFTFMRHIVTGSMNVLYQNRRPGSYFRPASLENGPLGAGTVLDFSWNQLLNVETCVHCGRCDQMCPAFISGKPLSPRRVIRNIKSQAGEILKKDLAPSSPSFPKLTDAVTPDEIWACTTCMACAIACPLFVNPLDKIMALRQHEALESGALPEESRNMLRDLEIFGDPEGKGTARRDEWALGLDVPHIGELGYDAEILLWVGCYGSFHPRYRKVVRSMVKILNEGRVRFGTLGSEEICCGDGVRRLGREDLFVDLARKNIASFKKYHVKTLVTLCPHGYNTFKNEYKELGANFQVFHAVEYVSELISKKRIMTKYSLRKLITIHDPCYLARGNGIYSELRKILNEVPDIRLKEMHRSGLKTFCCGGGGGRMWLREHTGSKINILRSKEIVKRDVDIVATACPFCLVMLEDGLESVSPEGESLTNVLDIMEILCFSLARH